jgi:hypothetical protein
MSKLTKNYGWLNTRPNASKTLLAQSRPQNCGSLSNTYQTNVPQAANQDSYGLFSANRTTGLLFHLVTLTKYRCFQALPTNKALFMAENRAVPPPKIHAIPIAMSATGASVQHLPQ